MKRPNTALAILMLIYALLAVAALWRTVNTQALDLFTLGVIPVLVGLVMRTSWAGVVFKIYLAIQTVGLMALATAAIIAYQVTPQDVKLVINNQNIPIIWVVISAISMLLFQYWVAFSRETKAYLTRADESIF